MRRFILILALACLPTALAAQLEPPSAGGLAGLDQALRRLGHFERVLVIGAHPDDEDTELLTMAARGLGAETAYLSLNRGEGGQNLIGDELGEALGLLRSQELLAARQLDGASQFFTRVYDFGFSKTLDDTWAHWPRDSVLKDVVRIVRRFRPQVVVSIFTGTPRDGHGQHQAAGWAAREAFRIAGDSSRFPELGTEEGLDPWSPAKLYGSTRFDTAATTLTLDGGELDPVLGRSYHQIAMAGRSLHRSQDMGMIQGIGPSRVRLRLLEDRSGMGSGGLFAGLDTTLMGVPAVAGLGPSARRQLEPILTRYRLRVDSARAAVGPLGWERVSRLLEAAAGDLEAARRVMSDNKPGGAVRAVQTDPVLAGDPFEDEHERLGRALILSHNLVVDGLSRDERVTPGSQVQVTASLWNAGSEPTRAEVCLGSPALRWAVTDSSGSRDVLLSPRRGACLRVDTQDGRLIPLPGGGSRIPAGQLVTANLTATVPAAMAYSSPYFLRRPRVGDLYQWDPDARWAWGLPFEPPIFAVEVQQAVGSGFGRLTREITLRGNDQATGEFRRPVVVVPRIDVRLEPASEVWPMGATGTHSFRVSLTHGGRDTAQGVVALELPPGWTAPPPIRFRLTSEDQVQQFEFQIRPPDGARPGPYPVRALARDDAGRVYDVGIREVRHPHIHPRAWVTPAASKITLVDLALPRLRRVAYVRGAADRIPEALEAVGLPIEVIDGTALTTANLNRFDVIVIGPRAFETDTALPRANPRIIEFARQGGLVVVQYQQYGFFSGGFAPYRLTVTGAPPGGSPREAIAAPGRDSLKDTQMSLRIFGGHDRVTDENAPVRWLDPATRLARYPNRIGPDDWKGWVQERGLYFARDWDKAFKPALEMHDPGERPLQGALLVAPVGRGTWVYTGLSLFRQLPAGVPGAHRLFANLLALVGPGPVS